MKELARTDNGVVLYVDDEGSHCLSVYVGGIFSYDIRLRLSEEELESYQQQGLKFLSRLGDDVAGAREKYADRIICG